MKPFYLKIYAALFCAFSAYSVQAQESVNATGGEATGNGSVSFSVGIPVYTTVEGQNGSSAQGVQHPIEVFNVGIEDSKEVSSFINVFPNPTTQWVTVSFVNANSSLYSYRIIDMKGQLIQKGEMTNSETPIDLSAYPVGTYFLQVDQENKTIDQFKLIKQ